MPRTMTRFGRYLDLHDLDRATVAKGCDITPSYVTMLAHGTATPGMKAARRIAAWTLAHVKDEFNNPAGFSMENWEP